jgi:uncharacterized protein YoxC
MNAAGAVTLLAVAIIVGALASTLIRIAQVLKHVNETLDTVINAVGGIEQATRPITPILTAIAGDLAATQKALEDLLASKSSPKPAKPVMVSRLRQRGA